MLFNKNNSFFSRSHPVLSEEIETSPIIIDNQEHLIGTKKIVNLSSPDFAESHFPNPKDYTLENLIKSGAPLEEVPSPYAGGTPNNLEDTLGDVINTLSNDDNFKDK